jgi:nitroreductase
MNVMDAIRTRRNTKLFKPDPIDQDQLLSWLEAASYAPNHRMTEPWEIIIVGEETRAKLNHKANFGGAPVVIAVLSKPADKPFDRDEHIMAVSCFVENFMLAAHEAGVGTRWASLGLLPQNRDILGVTDGSDIVGVFGVGYPAEVPEAAKRTAITDKIRYMK